MCLRGAEHATPKYVYLHKDYLELVIFKKQQTQKKLWKPSRGYPLERDSHNYKEKSPFARVSPFLFQEEEEG